MIKKYSRGYFVILTLVFSAVFLTLISALSGFIFVQKKVQLAKENQEKALHLAEAGLEYYKWFLAHYPDDATDGTGVSGPYVHVVDDPEGGVLGYFSLDIEANVFCGAVSDVTIRSTGWTEADPIYKRTVEASYVRPSVAQYSHIVDDNVWAGSDRIINGPYHSNKGVRMDGTHNAKVTSGVSDWLCTSSFGCSNTTEDGVFGSGTPGAQLWEFPVTNVDFAGITVDLDALETLAQNDGIYIEEETINNFGYHITFQNDGSLVRRRVTGVTSVYGYSTQFGWQPERSVIATTAGATTVQVPEDCPVIYVQDDVWIDGIVNGKVLIAVNDSSEASNPSIILNENLTYDDPSEDGITVIAENNVLVGLQVPNVMDISGIFIAQKGRFGRNHYCATNCTGSGSSGDTGLHTAETVEVATGWSNMTVARVGSSDNSDASCDATCDNNDDAQLSDFSFGIPSGATINGIEVQAEMAEGNSTGSIGVELSLSWNDGASFTSTKTRTVNGTSDSTYTFGGSSDTWGRTWSDSEFADGNFRLKIDKLADSDTLSIDRVRVEVSYTTGAVGLPSSLDEYVTRSTLNTTGTVVSKYRVGTKWTSGGVFSSGFSQRNDSFDQNLSVSPPPFTPWTSEDFRLHSWKEVQ